MAKKKRTAKLSVGEMRLMAVLWKWGPLKLAEAYREQPGRVGYTTIQTQLNRLVKKGVASRSNSRPTKYQAIVSPHVAGAGMLQLLVDTVGGGSVIPVVAQLVSSASLTKDDVRELRRVIEDAGPKPAQSAKKANRAKGKK